MPDLPAPAPIPQSSSGVTAVGDADADVVIDPDGASVPFEDQSFTAPSVEADAPVTVCGTGVGILGVAANSCDGAAPASSGSSPSAEVVDADAPVTVCGVGAALAGVAVHVLRRGGDPVVGFHGHGRRRCTGDGVRCRCRPRRAVVRRVRWAGRCRLVVVRSVLGRGRGGRTGDRVRCRCGHRHHGVVVLRDGARPEPSSSSDASPTERGPAPR